MLKGILKARSICLGTVALLILLSTSFLHVNAQTPGEASSTQVTYSIRLFNCDDGCRAYVNGSLVRETGFGEDSGRFEISGQLTKGRSNQIHFEVINDIGAITYGFQVWKNDLLAFERVCGQAFVVGCENNRQDFPIGVAREFDYTVALPQDSHVVEQTVTGFYWPLGKGRYVPSRCGTWLGRDAEHDGCYDKGLYHLGVDMVANVNDPVYAIADGEIIGTSTDGEGNLAVFVKHRLSDGTEFVAVYGHVRVGADVLDRKHVEAGARFASVGTYSGGSHLHFAIHPGVSAEFTKEAKDESGQIFKMGWGRASNYFWPDTNGFIEPVSWIMNNAPTGGRPAPKPTLFGQVSDPSGDADHDSRAPISPDLVYGSIAVKGGNLFISVRFAPGTFNRRTHCGISLDTDQNPATGHPGINSNGTMDAGVIGSEFIVEIDELDVGQARVLRYDGPPINTFGLVASFPVTTVRDGFDVAIPLSAIGNADGTLDFKVVSQAHIGPQSYTGILDVMPNVGLPSAAVRPRTQVTTQAAEQLSQSLRATQECAGLLPRSLAAEVGRLYPASSVVTIKQLDPEARSLFTKQLGHRCPGIVLLDFFGDHKDAYGILLTTNSSAPDSSNARLILVSRVRPSAAWQVQTLEESGELGWMWIARDKPGVHKDVYGQKTIRAKGETLFFAAGETVAILYGWTGKSIDKIWLAD